MASVAELFATLGLKPDEKSWERGTKLIEGVKKGLEMFIGYEAVKWIGELVKSTAESAIGAERMAQKIGVTTEAVQELGYAAKVSGVNTEELQHGFQKLALGLREAQTKGTGPLVDGLGTLGASFEEIRGKSPDEMLEKLADHFADMPDGAKKTAASMQIFGKAGADLIPFLNRGGDGIKELREEAEDLGVVMSKDTAKSFEELEESTFKIQGALTGLKNTAIKALLPVIKEMADSLFEWVKANREVIASTIKGAVEGVITAVRVLAYGVGLLVDGFQFLKEHGELARAILIALGIVIGALAAEAALGWIVGFAPIVAVVAAITGVILVLQDVWKSITTGKGIAAAAWRWIARQAKEFWQGLKDIAHGVADFFTGIAETIKDAFRDAFNWIENKALELGEGLAKLPVIKQLVELGHYIGGGSGQNENTTVITRDAIGADNKSHGATISYGDTNITVHVDSATGDPQEIAAKIQQAIQEHHDQTWRDIHAATGGADQ